MKMMLLIETGAHHGNVELHVDGQKLHYSNSLGYSPGMSEPYSIQQGIDFLRDYKRQVLDTNMSPGAITALRVLHDAVTTEIGSVWSSDRLRDAVDRAHRLLKETGK